MLTYQITFLDVIFFSLSKLSYTGKKINGSDEIDKLNRTSFGKKESTGYTENNKNYCSPNEDKNQFNTLYHRQFYNKNKLPINRYACQKNVCINEMKDDGYAKYTKFHI